MSTQQYIYAAGSKNRPPMLNKDNYVPWSSLLLRYAKSKPNGKLIYNSIMNVPYVRRMIHEPGDPDREVLVAETYHDQTNDELTEKGKKSMFPQDQPSLVTYMQQPQLNNNFNPQPSFNTNYMQQPMPNLEDITDPITAMNMALVLIAKAFKLNYSTPTNNNQRISSNPRNSTKCQESGVQNAVQNLGIQNVGNQNGLIVVLGIANQNLNPNGNENVVAARAEVRPRKRDAAFLQTQLLIAQKEEAMIQLQDEEFDFMAAVGDLEEIEEVNANCILMANLQQASTSGTQTNKAPVYDSDGSDEVHEYDNFYNNEIFNMFTQEEQYTELLDPILEPHQVQQNDSNVISIVSSVEQGGGTVEQHAVTVEETSAYLESLYNNLAIEVDKVNSVNRKMKETNANLTTELARYKNQEKCFEIKASKFVRDFKSLTKEADESLAKQKALELEIERLLRAFVSQDIMSIVQSNSVVDTSNLQTELERTKERFENYIIKKENEYAKLWNDWYKKCEECKYDKISYDKAYNDMQQKIERLQAQLGDQKGKKLRYFRVNITTKTRRPQPKRTTKNDRDPSASKSSCIKNKEVKEIVQQTFTASISMKWPLHLQFASWLVLLLLSLGYGIKGKSKKASHPPKPVPNSKQRLHLLHMDLCGPMRVESINVLLQAPVIIVRINNDIEFKNQVPKEYFDSVGISHQASSAKAIATTCYTQNRSIIHRGFNKTPYKLINGRKLDISFLHVFGALCYPKNDREDIGKLGAKGDIGFFNFYSANSCAYRIYNQSTKKIIEAINVTFDKILVMAFEQRSSKPGLQSMTSGQISLGLDLTYAPSIITIQQLTERELDLLFKAM
ncbi:retrovirus-related pol polyprotein from transposon TNT 1-94 [Tanacetum coccineum]